MRKFLAPLALASIMFGCADFTEDLASYDRVTVLTFEELKAEKCSSNNEGETVVFNGDSESGSRVYTCKNSVWVGDKRDSVKYEKPTSSSSKKTSSSSSKKGSSSSSAKPSSSGAMVLPPSEVKFSSSSAIVIVPEGPSASESGLGACVATNSSSVSIGDPVSFKFSFNKEAASSFSISEIATAQYEWDYKDGVSDGTENKANSSKVVFAKSGNKVVEVTVTVAGQTETVPCSVHVSGAPITGCMCVAKSPKADMYGDATGFWSVTGCKTTANIISYDWTGATGDGASASHKFLGKGQSMSPIVVVENDDNTKIAFDCETVISYDSRDPEYELTEPGVYISMPAGKNSIVMNLPEDWEFFSDVETFPFACIFDDITEASFIEDEIISGELSGVVSLPFSHSIGGYNLVVDLDVPAECRVLY